MDFGFHCIPSRGATLAAVAALLGLSRLLRWLSYALALGRVRAVGKLEYVDFFKPVRGNAALLANDSASGLVVT